VIVSKKHYFPSLRRRGSGGMGEFGLLAKQSILYLAIFIPEKSFIEFI